MNPMLGIASLLIGVGIVVSASAWERRRHRQIRDLNTLLDMAYLESEPRRVKDVAAVLARTGQAAERALAGTGFLRKVREDVERSDYRLSPGELLMLSAVLGIVGILAGVSFGSPILAVMLMVFGLFAPIAKVRRSTAKRTRKFEAQFPAVLEVIAAALESGAGVPQALELVVAEADEPSASEIGRVLAATRLGEPLVEAMKVLAVRLDSQDIRWTVRAIIVQQRTGGRLAEVLRIVASVMRSRAEVKGEVSTLTAEGRLSAYILSALPIGLAGFLAMVRPDYLRPLYTEPIGIALITVAAIMVTISYFVMRKIVKIEV